MGFFSWKTQDTDKSIANIHSTREPFTVFMHDNKGNRWEEDSYDGYGKFGGKDFYELLAEMNGKTTRDEGIDLFYGNSPFLSPNLSEYPEWKWKNEAPKSCRDQGYFYSDDDGEDTLETGYLGEIP